MAKCFYIYLAQFSCKYYFFSLGVRGLPSQQYSYERKHIWDKTGLHTNFYVLKKKVVLVPARQKKGWETLCICTTVCAIVTQDYNGKTRKDTTAAAAGWAA